MSDEKDQAILTWLQRDIHDIKMTLQKTVNTVNSEVGKVHEFYANREAQLMKGKESMKSDFAAYREQTLAVLNMLLTEYPEVFEKGADVFLGHIKDEQDRAMAILELRRNAKNWANGAKAKKRYLGAAHLKDKSNE